MLPVMKVGVILIDTTPFGANQAPFPTEIRRHAWRGHNWIFLAGGSPRRSICLDVRLLSRPARGRTRFVDVGTGLNISGPMTA